MAELLIRVRSKVSSDPYLDCKLTKRGDVIVAVPDNHPWGKEELSNPDWRILKVPALDLNEAEALCTEEVGDPRTNRMLQRRAFRLVVDKDDVPQAVKAWLRDDTRQQPSLTLTGVAGRTLIRAIREAKASLPDPSVG